LPTLANSCESSNHENHDPKERKKLFSYQLIINSQMVEGRRTWDRKQQMPFSLAGE
jgi:hypothetical protein